jgi:hypothetical protein
MEDERKYICIGFFIHGEYGKSAQPYKVNPHASKSLKSFKSTPKLMTFTNSSPGNVVLSAADGSENTKLTNYFKTNSNINLMADTNQNAKDQDQIIAESFLNYSRNGLATLQTNPRDDLERYRKTNKIEKKYVCRNSYICNNKVGIGHTFPNKTFSTSDPPTDPANMDSWGIFIFNNNCGIEPGTRIEEELPEMTPEDITNEDGEDIGVRFSLNDIIFRLEIKYRLTREDYLFLFDYTCSIFNRDIIPSRNERSERSFGREVFQTLGFGNETGKKRKGTRGGKKKTQKNRKNNGMR